VIKRYIEAEPIGRRRLAKLTPAQVQAWVNSLKERVAPLKVRNAHARLHIVTDSKVLGHSSPSITGAIYAHALDESKSEAITGLSKRLQGPRRHNSQPQENKEAPPSRRSRLAR
jgi:hypothetical protein